MYILYTLIAISIMALAYFNRDWMLQVNKAEFAEFCTFLKKNGLWEKFWKARKIQQGISKKRKLQYLRDCDPQHLMSAAFNYNNVGNKAMWLKWDKRWRCERKEKRRQKAWQQ